MADNVSLYEEYLFAKDKSEFLRTCKKSSDLKKFIRICHLLNHPEAALEQEDLEEIELWKRSDFYGEKRNLVMKHALMAILNEGDSEKRVKLMQDFNDRYLKYKFNDARQAGGNQTVADNATGEKLEFKTSLTKDDLKEMSVDFQLEAMINAGLDGDYKSPFEFNQSMLAKIDFAKIKSKHIKEEMFQALESYVNSKVKLTYLEYRPNSCRVQAGNEN